MALKIGMRLGHYEITSPIGAGGMGEVYRATDTKLKRDVAIKVLPDDVARDRDRLARFEREAHVLASLNHPHIAAIYGLEELDGVPCLVLELVEGRTLAEHLEGGGLPVREALELARQIALALEAAHEKGIIHRDLKPANIKVTPDGSVKVLDFGLAKTLADESTETSGDASQSPTLTAAATRAGVILGTAAYMSPEQARGKRVDRRTDIWAFGVVLYESLTGKALFPGETATDSIGAILHKEPDWSALPPETPVLVRHLLRRCLDKEHDRRLRDAGDARIDLETVLTDPSGLESGFTEPRSSWRFRVVMAGALSIALAAGVLIGLLFQGTGIEPEPSPRIGFSIDVSGQGLTLETAEGNLAVDPAGTSVAFAGRRDGERQIFVRTLENSEGAGAVAGTEGGRRPFFSPDGRWLGFLRDGKLMKVPSGGGPALTICRECELNTEIADPVWLDDGTIVYCDGPACLALARVDADSGIRETLTEAGPHDTGPDRKRAITGFDSPTRVTGQPYILASVYYDVSIVDYDVVTVSLEDGSVRRMLSNATEPRFMPPGLLLFSRESSLFAVPFDPRRGVVSGDAEQVVEEVLVNPWADNAQYAVAANGTLAYVPGRRVGPGRNLVRVFGSGRTEPLLPEADALLGEVRVSPDGARLLLNTIRRRAELWVFDLNQRSFDLVTNAAPAYSLTWMPDGREVIYFREGYGRTPDAIVRHVIGAGSDVLPIRPAGGFNWPSSVSPDGEYLLMEHYDPTARNRSDLLLFSLEAGGYAEPLVATTAQEDSAVFSPDGRWYAYESDESGRDEIYVRRFPNGGRRWQVSSDGGQEPRWSPSGTRLYFSNQGSLFESRIHTAGGFSAEAPARLLDMSDIAAAATAYDVLPDDSFVMIEPAPWERERRRIEVLVGWDGGRIDSQDNASP